MTATVAPALAGIFALKLPVRNLAASRCWYEAVFGLELEFEFPDDDGVVRGVVYSVPGLGDTGLDCGSDPTSPGCPGSIPSSSQWWTGRRSTRGRRTSRVWGFRTGSSRRRSGGCCCSTTRTA
jgi:catechol 2,3-dioxygenase-like lactoylglutathione lyase family enzyme